MQPVNPHLAFEPYNTDPDKSMTIPDMLGLGTQADLDRFQPIVTKAIQEFDTYSEGASYLSKAAATPQELALLSFMFFGYIHDKTKRDEAREKAIESLVNSLLD